LPAELGDHAALWQRLTADATANERNGDLAGEYARIRARDARDCPLVSLRVADGWLIGVDLGEWGGVLWWVASDGGRHRRLATANVKALVATGDEIVVVTGLAHMTSREGSLLHLERTDGWCVARTTLLPSTPTAVAVLPPLGLVLTFGLDGEVRTWRDGVLSEPHTDLAWPWLGPWRP
jgi:hypothetical protein